MAAYHKAKLVSHAQRVLRLYKKCIRGVNLRRAWRHHIVEYDRDHIGFWDGFIVSGSNTKDFLTVLDEDLLPDYHPIYVRIMIRHEFEKNKNMTDMTKARQLVLETEERMRNFYATSDVSDFFIDSPGGLAFNRYPHQPDWLLDTWHPLERAQYPKYFGIRNQRKLEHIERWNVKYGKPDDAPELSKLKEHAKQEKLE